MLAKSFQCIYITRVLGMHAKSTILSYPVRSFKINSKLQIGITFFLLFCVANVGLASLGS